MPRKKKISTFYDEEDFSDSKSGKEDSDVRAPRNAANARERARMRVLSKAFCRLKTTLPWVPADTKLSKLDTLRLAATYIAHLRAVLRDDVDVNDSARSLSLTLSWPFALQSTTPVLINNNCGVSSTSSLCSNSNQYRNQQQFHNSQSYNHLSHQNVSIRHSYEGQIAYY